MQHTYYDNMFVAWSGACHTGVTFDIITWQPLYKQHIVRGRVVGVSLVTDTAPYTFVATKYGSKHEK